MTLNADETVENDETPNTEEPYEKGRPEYYWDPAVVQDYENRYKSGLGAWKHQRKLKTLQRWLLNCGQVLEVACGPGRFAEIIREHQGIATDLSLEMIRYYQNKHPNLKLLTADAAQLPFDTEQFDAVYSIRFVSHLRGKFRRQVLSELARVSNKYVIIDGRHHYNLRTWSRHLRFKLGLAKSDKLRHSFQEFERELSAVGLKIIDRYSVAWGLSARVLFLTKKIT